MIFAALRRLVGRLAVAIVAGSILLPATAETHALANDDPGCAWTGASSPTDTPVQVDAVTHPADASHCAICHWLHAIAGAMPSDAAATLSPLLTREIALARLAWWHDEMLPLDRPARAPPAALFPL